MVLSGTTNENEKAVLSLEKNNDMYDGRLRLYNFATEPKGILSIGFYNNQNVIKAGLSRTSSMLYTFKLDINSIEDEFSCAVVNFYNGDLKPLLYGNTQGVENNIEKLNKVMNSEFEKDVSVEEVKKVLDDNGIEYEKDYKDEIEKEIDKNMHSDCLSCKYRKAFYEKNGVKIAFLNYTYGLNGHKMPKDTEYLVDLLDDSDKIVRSLKSAIDLLFKNNEKEEFLESLIPNSKWVKVEYEESGDYYILGLIYEQDELLYIVYGVPGIYQKMPPKEISGYPVWFPLDANKPESFGYWLSYQDAKTGENIKAVVE